MFFLLGSEICLHSVECLLKLFNRLNLLPYVNFLVSCLPREVRKMLCVTLVV